MRLPREMVKASQRERLLVAIVELVDRDGTPAVTVGALTERAHVSRGAFYELFEGVEDCLLAAYQAQTARMTAWVVSAYNTPGLGEQERLQAANDVFVNVAQSWPAAARVCIGDILTAGPRAREAQEQALGWVRRAARPGADADGARRVRAPLCRATALLGGARRALYDHLREARAEDLSALTRQLLDWARECSGAPEMPSRRAAGPAARTKARGTGANTDDARRRILDAVLELAGREGYRQMTHREIAERAKVSNSTFYKHFPSKEQAFLCACQEAHERALKPAQVALERAADWPEGVCVALAAYVDELVADAGCTRAGALEVLTLGHPGLTHLDTCASGLQELFRPGVDAHPAVAPSLVKGLAGSIEETVRHYCAKRVLHQLPGAVPELSRVILTPFLGVPRALEVARVALAV